MPYWSDSGVDDGFDPSNATVGKPSPTASYLAATSVIRKNFIINGYSGVWAADHDDGSQRWLDTENFMVWGGCKNFLGNTKTCSRNVLVFPGYANRSFGNKPCQTDDNHVYADQSYQDNHCFTLDGRVYSMPTSSCDPKDIAQTAFRTANNSFYSANATAFVQACNTTTELGLAEWQAKGQDQGSRALGGMGAGEISAEVMRLGRAVLGWGFGSSRA